MKRYQQDAPYSVKIEFVEGCPLRCPFCAMNAIREPKDNNYKFMDMAVIDRIGEEIAKAGWNSRFEFTMRGEPTMHPELTRMVARLHAHTPKQYKMLLTNGHGLVKQTQKTIQALFEAGVTTIGVDDYQGIAWADKVRKVMAKREQILAVHEYPADGPIANPHQRRKNKRLVFIAPIDLATGGTHASLNNQCGSAAPLNTNAVGQRCARPFREMVFRYDGEVVLCCNDWLGELRIGNIMDNSIEELWRHPAMTAMRKYLYHGMRAWRPCEGCDSRSYRVGLLPDPKGKVTLAKPSSKDRAALRAALAKGPMTPRINNL